jgi:hypothetical protein
MGSLPISEPVPGKECAGATGCMTEIHTTCLQLSHPPLLVAAALPLRAAIDPADPLPRHRAHGIRGKCN